MAMDLRAGAANLRALQDTLTPAISATLPKPPPFRQKSGNPSRKALKLLKEVFWRAPVCEIIFSPELLPSSE